jgi:hypothetical protein
VLSIIVIGSCGIGNGCRRESESLLEGCAVMVKVTLEETELAHVEVVG